MHGLSFEVAPPHVLVSASFLESHLKMLKMAAEEQVENYVADVINRGSMEAKVRLGDKQHREIAEIRVRVWAVKSM